MQIAPHGYRRALVRGSAGLASHLDPSVRTGRCPAGTGDKATIAPTGAQEYIMRMNAYLIFNGQCEEAFRFYQRCLGGEIAALVRPGDVPDGTGPPAGNPGRILHARLLVGDAVLMGSDGCPERPEAHGGFHVTVNVDDPTEAERIFHALAEGGAVRSPLEETFWAERFGMVADRFGVPWMINCEKPMPT